MKRWRRVSGRRRQRRFERFRDRVLDGPGHLDTGQRRAGYARDLEGLPEPARAYVAKVHDHAYRVVDEDVAALLVAGYTQDQIFELTVAAATGAGVRRLERALAAMHGN